MSSGSDSDEDFVPGEPEQLSEEESANEETELQYEKEVELKTQKRKSTQDNKAKKKIKTKKAEVASDPEDALEELEEKLNTEEEKKKEDDLWAKFLEGTDTKPKPVVKEIETNNTPEKVNATIENVPKKEEKTNDNDDMARERRIFEFAGETIVVENNVIKEKIKVADSSATGSKLDVQPRSRGSGLSSVLNQLNKKNKLSTLEKSKLDWSTYKKEEGIEEEIESHNKGKGGYLERKDFLERADVRQYEIERDLRMSRRSNR